MLFNTLRWFLLFMLLTVTASSTIALGSSADITLPDVHPDAEISTAPVVIDGRVLFRVVGMTSFPARERAAAIADRIERIAQDSAVEAGSVRILEADGYSSIVVGNSRVMALFDADARVERVERKTLGFTCSTRISKAIEDYRRERSPEFLQQSSLETLGATGGADGGGGAGGLVVT